MHFWSQGEWSRREGLIWFVIGGRGKVNPEGSVGIGWDCNQRDFWWGPRWGRGEDEHGAFALSHKPLRHEICCFSFCSHSLRSDPIFFSLEMRRRPVWEHVSLHSYLGCTPSILFCGPPPFILHPSSIIHHPSLPPSLTLSYFHFFFTYF